MIKYRVAVERFGGKSTEIDVEDSITAQNWAELFRKEKAANAVTIYGVYQPYLPIHSGSDVIGLKHWVRNKTGTRWKEIPLRGGFPAESKMTQKSWIER